MALDTGDIIRTTASFTLGNGTICQNIFHHMYTGVPGIADSTVLSAIDGWLEAMYAEIDDLVKDDVVANLAFVSQVEWVETRWEVTRNLGTVTMTFTPTVATDALPNMDSAFVTQKTLRPKTVGRKFLIPFAETQQADSYLIGSAVTAVVAWAADSIDDVYLGPVNDLHPGVVRTGVDSFLEFTVAVVTNVLGTQRRRRPGVGS